MLCNRPKTIEMSLVAGRGALGTLKGTLCAETRVAGSVPRDVVGKPRTGPKRLIPRWGRMRTSWMGDRDRMPLETGSSNGRLGWNGSSRIRVDSIRWIVRSRWRVTTSEGHLRTKIGGKIGTTTGRPGTGCRGVVINTGSGSGRSDCFHLWRVNRSMHLWGC